MKNQKQKDPILHETLTRKEKNVKFDEIKENKTNFMKQDLNWAMTVYK